jgi:hypothetical protein
MVGLSCAFLNSDFTFELVAIFQAGRKSSENKHRYRKLRQIRRSIR